MGLILQFGTPPAPLDVADDGLATFMDVDVFDRDFLLAFSTMAVEGFEQSPRQRLAAGDVAAQ